jgi:dynactin complex subunit
MVNKKDISVGINVTAKIEEAQKNLSILQSQFGKLNVPNSVKNEFLTLFSSMEKEFEKLSEKTANGKLKFIDSSAAEKATEKIDSLYETLIRKLESRGIAAAGLQKD